MSADPILPAPRPIIDLPARLRYCFLRSNSRTRLITIDIGANDLFVLQRTCARTPDPNACFTNGFPVLLQTLVDDLGVIHAAIRGAGFSGELVAVTYHVTNFADPVAVLVIDAINQVVDRVIRNFGCVVASGLSAFQRASAGLGGDTFLAGLPGDIHPTAVGQTLLAQTVVDTILSTCQAAIATGCLNRNP
jgi:hypothetical protein